MSIRPGATAGHADHALADVVAALASGVRPGASVEPALRTVATRLAEATGAGVAIYAREPSSPALGLRVYRGGSSQAPGPEAVLLPGDHETLLARAHRAPGTIGAPGDDDGAVLVARAGMPGGVLIPVRMDGETIGALALVPARGTAPSPDGLTVAVQAAQALGLAMGTARLFAGLRERSVALDRQSRQLDALAAVARRVAVSVDEGDVATTVAREARRLVAADLAVLLVRDAGGEFHPGGADGWTPAEPLPAVAMLGAGAGPGPVWMGRELAVAIATGEDDEGPAPGLLVVARREGAPFGDDDLERLTGLAHQAAVALENARLVTRLRREQDERLALASALAHAQEDERRRLAEDIHDGPVQDLVGMSLLLDALAADLRPLDPALTETATRASASARDAVRALRRAIFDLHPMALEELGFAAATRTLVQRLEWQGVEVELDAGPLEDLPADLRTVAFRTCQEAIANVLRHAEPRTVRIVGTREGDATVLEVIDDGRGFDASRAGAGIADGHLGLAAMRQRASLVGGDLQVFSDVGRGTTVRLTLPGTPSA